MKRILKLLTLVMITVTLFSIVAVPVSAASNAKVGTYYTFMNKNGKANGNDTFTIKGKALWLKKTLTIGNTATCSVNTQIKNFLKKVSFTVKIYDSNGNQTGKTMTLRFGDSFTLPRTLLQKTYTVVITKNIPSSVPYIVLCNANYLKYRLK